MLTLRALHRKGFFFTIEALFAVLILLIGILIVFSARPNFMFHTQTFTYADGIQNILTTKTMAELGRPWHCLPESSEEQLQKCGERHVTYPDNTILEQLATYLLDPPQTETGMSPEENARDLARQIIIGAIAPTHYYNLTLKDEFDKIVKVDDSQQAYVKPNDDATIRFVSRRLVYFRNATGVRGPIIATMEVWR